MNKKFMKILSLVTKIVGKFAEYEDKCVSCKYWEALTTGPVCRRYPVPTRTEENKICGEYIKA